MRAQVRRSVTLQLHQPIAHDSPRNIGRRQVVRKRAELLPVEIREVARNARHVPERAILHVDRTEPSMKTDVAIARIGNRADFAICQNEAP